MAQTRATQEANQEFRKYRLREPISESFLGTRYRALSGQRDPDQSGATELEGTLAARSSAFALRLLRAPSPGLIERAARAAKAVRYLDHPNVLAPIQLIRAQTRLGVITQDVDGLTLAELLRLSSARGEALPQAVTLRIALDLLDGVIALHETEHGAPHYEYACGGLTPDSIHIGRDGHARLIDPGVAGAAAAVPFWGHDPVALAYTAPEQSGAEPLFNPTSDVFAIGVMLWEMLAGQPLFGAPNAAETLERLHTASIPRVQRLCFTRGEPISAAVAQLVAHALQREPRLRLPNCEELSACLSEAAESASYIEVIEHCYRLTSGLSDADHARAASAFEAAAGDLQPDTFAAEDGSGGFADVPADLFEPLTARVNAPFCDYPEPLPPVLESRPITAFPISDFVPLPPTPRRHYAPLAAAGALLLVLAALAFAQRDSSEPEPRPPPAAVARPAPQPLATPNNITTTPDPLAPRPAFERAAEPPAEAELAAEAPLVAPDPSALRSTPELPAPTDASADDPAATATPAKRGAASARRRAPKPETKHAAIGDTEAAPFIPDDI